jgi:hypothetical protein
MVADADGEALPRAGKYGERAILHLQECAGVFEEGCARAESCTYRGSARRAGSRCRNGASEARADPTIFSSVSNRPV